MKNEYYRNLLLEEKKVKRNGMHSFHRYFGKLIPAIPGFAMKEFTKEGDYVLDTFCGSGTTLLVGKIYNRNAFGVDLNPLAVLISKTKTTKIEPGRLEKNWKKIKESYENDQKDYSKEAEPYCVNMDHWFKDFVKKDLLKLKTHIFKLPSGNIRNFFLGCFSAFLRGISNADPHHIFPGYSKRLRELDKKGKRDIDVFSAFEKAVLKRIKYMESLPLNSSKIKVFVGESRNLPLEIKNISLIVVNPPYISSIRYLETMKIEMGWLNFIKGQKDYLNLDRKGIGTERFYKNDLKKIPETNIKKLDIQVNALQQENQLKMAKVVATYFIDMQKSISEMNRVLKKGGHLVFKISDSLVRNHLISTHQYFIDIAESLGMTTLAIFQDKINKNSRSLLTARNTYSGIITHDWILIFEK